MTENKEIWKDVPAYEGIYQVSNLGNIRSLKYNNTQEVKLLKLKLRYPGYLYVNLSKNNKQKKYNVHRLVASAFIPNPNDKKEVNHINGKKTDNALINLEWATKKENEYHAMINNLKASHERHGGAKLTKIQVADIREINRAGLFTRKEIAEEYSVTPEMIGNIVNYKNWK